MPEINKNKADKSLLFLIFCIENLKKKLLLITVRLQNVEAILSYTCFLCEKNAILHL
jgi:hypothetical protein